MCKIVTWSNEHKQKKMMQKPLWNESLLHPIRRLIFYFMMHTLYSAVWKRVVRLMKLFHYHNVIRTSCSLKSPVIRLFVWELMWTHIKETSKSALLSPWEGNSPMTCEFSAQRASNAGRLLLDDVIMSGVWHMFPHIFTNVLNNGPTAVGIGQ